MWFPPIKSLLEANEGSAFLLLAWEELFSVETLDSYQPKLLNLPALVEELEQIGSRAERSKKWEKHIRKIQEELKSACTIEQEFLEGMPRYQWALEHLATTESCSQVVAGARILRASTPHYEIHAIKAFDESVKGLPRTKSAVFCSLHRLATIALRRGRSSDDFAHLFVPDNLQRKPEEVAKLIIDACVRMDRQFTCILAVRGKSEDLHVFGRKAGFDLLSERHFPADAESERFRDLTKGNVWLSIKVDASKPIEAAQMAIRRLRPAIDIFNFYQHGASSFLDDVLILQSDSNSTLVHLQQSWRWQQRRRKNARTLTKLFFNTALEERFSGRVLNALEHYSLSVF